MRRGWRVFCTSSIRPRHLALNSEMEISFIDSDLSDDLYYNHSHLLSQLPLGRSCAVDADRDAVDKRERLRVFCEDWRKHIADGQDDEWMVGRAGRICTCV